MNFISPQTLISEGDFLAFTLSGLGQSFTPFSFEIACLDKRDQTQAKQQAELSSKRVARIKAAVIAPGMIVFTPLDLRCAAGSQVELPQIVLSCGIHGDETAPIEICQAWIQQIILGQQALGVRVLFIFGNLDAIKAQKRFVSHNLNTLFSGQHSLNKKDFSLQAQKIPKTNQEANKISLEKKRVQEIEHWLDWFFSSEHASIVPRQKSPPASLYKRFHLDLHTAIRGSKYQQFAISPYLNGRIPDEKEREFLVSAGLECLLIAHAPTKAFTYFTSSTYQAVSYTLELGKVKPWGENDLHACAKFIDVLTSLLAGEAEFLKNYKSLDIKKQPVAVKQQKDGFPIFVMHREILRKSANFSFNFADDVDNFTVFPLGYVLAQNDHEKIKVDTANEAILFPNAQVALGQRALLTVIPLE